LSDTVAALIMNSKPRVPSTAAFVILLITLWALNLADAFQTIYFATNDMLAQEANFFIDFFLKKGPGFVLIIKILAMIFITIMLIRGWNDKKGIKVFRIQYSRDDVRNSILVMLTAGIIFYIVVVIFPFVALFASGSFNP
jgi:hypothetical protein